MKCNAKKRLRGVTDKELINCLFFVCFAYALLPLPLLQLIRKPLTFDCNFKMVVLAALRLLCLQHKVDSLGLEIAEN